VGRLEPEPVVPDTKDWTWVLARRCDACGLDASAVPVAELPDRLRRSATAWHEVLTSDPDRVRERPAPGVWSALEYGCHVRDVHRVFAHRLELMLGADDPPFPNWDQDATAVAERYAEQDPDVVAAELGAAAEAAARAFAAVTGEQWELTGRRSDGARFTVAALGRYYLHDPVHHLHDVTGAGTPFSR
jgi:hypothetical protein